MAPQFPKTLGRIAAILTMIGSLVWLQWPIDTSNLSPGALVFLVASFISWLAIEFAEYTEPMKLADDAQKSDNMNSEDVDKLNSILRIIDRRQYYVLKNKAVQTYMEDDDYNGVRDLIYYKEDDIFPFHNGKIQALYERFCSDCKEFYSEFYNLYTSDGRGRSTWRPSGDRYVSEERYEEVMGSIAHLDRMLSSLSDLWEQLISTAREELKGSSKSIERYDA